MDPVSQKTKNQNLLKTKTKQFKDNLRQSQNRIRASSSLHNLAGKLYSEKVNRVFSPKKRSQDEIASTMRNSSITKSNNQKGQSNPQTNLKSAMSGLAMRTYHVPCFAQLNYQLLEERKNLENKIQNLKQAIKEQKKKLNSAEYNAKKNINEKDKFMQYYNEAHLKSNRLNEQINLTNGQNRGLLQNINQLSNQIQQRKANVENQTKICDSLQTSTKNLKIDLMREEKERTIIKTDLSKSQKVMQSYSIQTKELQNQRALLLIQINQSVDVYKL